MFQPGEPVTFQWAGKQHSGIVDRYIKGWVMIHSDDAARKNYGAGVAVRDEHVKPCS